VTLDEMATLFLEWSKNNKKSYLSDQYRYEKHVEPRFKNTPLKDISPFHLEKLKSTLKQEELSPASIVQCLQLIRAIFNKTRAWGKHEIAFPAVTFPKVSNRRAAFLMPEQAGILLREVKTRSIMLWCQCVLGLYAGLRFGEIAGLELSDIDEMAGTIHIRDPKSGEDRHAYITEPIAAMFNEWWAVDGKKHGLVFPGSDGQKQKRVSPTFARIVDEIGFNSGVTDERQMIVFHSLRHSFASWLVMGGESLQTVKELMGHRDISTTMRYSHLAPDIKRNAAHNLVNTIGEKIVRIKEWKQAQ
jgi:integrase